MRLLKLLLELFVVSYLLFLFVICVIPEMLAPFVGVRIVHNAISRLLSPSKSLSDLNIVAKLYETFYLFIMTSYVFIQIVISHTIYEAITTPISDHNRNSKVAKLVSVLSSGIPFILIILTILLFVLELSYFSETLDIARKFRKVLEEGTVYALEFLFIMAPIFCSAYMINRFRLKAYPENSENIKKLIEKQLEDFKRKIDSLIIYCLAFGYFLGFYQEFLQYFRYIDTYWRLVFILFFIVFGILTSLLGFKAKEIATKGRSLVWFVLLVLLLVTALIVLYTIIEGYTITKLITLMSSCCQLQLLRYALLVLLKISYGILCLLLMFYISFKS